MATQSLGTDRGFSKVIQGGADDWEHYTEIYEVKNGVTVLPGHVLSGNGETAGQVDLGAAGDGAVSFIVVCLHQVGVSPIPDIDTGVVGLTATPTFVKCLRPSGGRFKVAVIRADESNDTELGTPLCLEATGHVQFLATLYTNATYATDMMVDFVGRAAEVTVDVAGTDLVQLIWF